MKMLVVAIALAVVLSGVCIAQRSRPHPKLSTAQRYTVAALAKVNDAQRAGEWDTDGHAEKARDLLDQANDELRQALRAGHKQPQ